MRILPLIFNYFAGPAPVFATINQYTGYSSHPHLINSKQIIVEMEQCSSILFI